MNIEDYRDYCLSLGADVEEKLPFTAFRYAADVLVFYVCGHRFAFLDIDHYGIVALMTRLAADSLKAISILRKAMLRHGFEPIDSEWWHFTLRNEPFPDTYFDFPIRQL